MNCSQNPVPFLLGQIHYETFIFFMLRWTLCWTLCGGCWCRYQMCLASQIYSINLYLIKRNAQLYMLLFHSFLCRKCKVTMYISRYNTLESKSTAPHLWVCGHLWKANREHSAPGINPADPHPPSGSLVEEQSTVGL